MSNSLTLPGTVRPVGWSALRMILTDVPGLIAIEGGTRGWEGRDPPRPSPPRRFWPSIENIVGRTRILRYERRSLDGWRGSKQNFSKNPAVWVPGCRVDKLGTSDCEDVHPWVITTLTVSPGQ